MGGIGDHANLGDFIWTKQNFDLIMAVNEKSGEHQSHFDTSSGDLKYLDQMLWQSVQ